MPDGPLKGIEDYPQCDPNGEDLNSLNLARLAGDEEEGLNDESINQYQQGLEGANRRRRKSGDSLQTDRDSHKEETREGSGRPDFRRKK